MLFQSIGAHYSYGVALRHFFTIGDKRSTRALEAALAKRYAGEVTLYSKGRAALAEAIRIATGGSGKVAISGLTCYSVVQAVEAAGCTPVYVDIRTSDLHFGPSELEASFAKHNDIAAVIVQNMLGIPCDIIGIEAVATAHRAFLIEDLAHSAGAKYSDGREVGTVGDVTMLSFGRDKAIDTVNGGALIVRRPEIIVQMRPAVHQPSFMVQLRDRLYPLLAWHVRTLSHIKLGLPLLALASKLKLTTRSADGDVDVTVALPGWQAKRASQELAALDQRAVRRRDKRVLYLNDLRQYIPEAALGDGVVPIRVPLLVDNRSAVLAALKKEQFFVQDIWYDVPVSPVRFYHKAHYIEENCPVAVEVARRIINLPTHQYVTSEQAAHMARIITEEAR